MAQRTHTPLHTGDESPSCGVCSRRARLKLTAPTATLDTPSPISSTESTKRLPMIWLLVHILLGSSFLLAQRRKPIIHFLPKPSLVPSTPYHSPNLQTFLSSPPKPQGLDFQSQKIVFCGQARKSCCSNPWNVHRATAGDRCESRSQHWGAGLWRAHTECEPRLLSRRCPEFCCIWVLSFQKLPGTSQASFCFPVDEASFAS